MNAAMLLAAAAVSFGLASAYEGYGTYYGGIGGQWGPGTCHQTFIYDGFWGIALNEAQYGDMGSGHYCGACVAGTIKQQDGSTKDFKGVIDNACGTCGYNDLDFGIDGDGRYDITWDFISCPEHDLMLSVEVGNPYYGLISVQGGGPVDGVDVNGAPATQQDGLWAIHSDAGQLGCGPEVRVRLRDGRDVTRCMSPGDFGGDCLNDGPRCSGGDRRRALWPTGGYHHETAAADAAAAAAALVA